MYLWMANATKKHEQKDTKDKYIQYQFNQSKKIEIGFI